MLGFGRSTKVKIKVNQSNQKIIKRVNRTKFNRIQGCLYIGFDMLSIFVLFEPKFIVKRFSRFQVSLINKLKVSNKNKFIKDQLF
jgi:virulence-associated protein VapD